jgi:hypothetical protein
LVGSDSRRLATLPIEIRKREGTRGLLILAEDRSKALSIEQTVPLDGADPTPGSFHFRVPDGATPADVLPALQLVALAHAPNHIELEVEGTTMGRLTLPEHQSLSADYVRFMEALGRIQAATQLYFAVPDDISDADRKAIAILDHLVRGEVLHMEGTGPAQVTIVVQDPEKLHSVISGGQTFRMGFTVDHSETVGGHVMTLPECVLTLPGATFGADAADLIPLAVGATIRVSLHNASEELAELRWSPYPRENPDGQPAAG